MSLEDFSNNLYTKCDGDNEALEREITKLLSGEHEEVPTVDNSILATLLRYNILSTKILSLILTKCPDSLEGTNGGYTALQILASQYYKTMKDLSKPSFTAQQRQELFSQAQTLLANIHYLVSNGGNPSPKIEDLASDTKLPCNPLHIAALLDDTRLMEVLMASSKLNLEQSTGHLKSGSQMLCLNFPLLCAIHGSASVFAYAQKTINADALNTIAIYGKTALHVAVISFLNNSYDDFWYYDYESARKKTVNNTDQLPLANHMITRLITVNPGLILLKDNTDQDVFDYILPVLIKHYSFADTDRKISHIRMLFAYCLQQIDDSDKADIFIRINSKIRCTLDYEQRKNFTSFYMFLWDEMPTTFKEENRHLYITLEPIIEEDEDVDEESRRLAMAVLDSSPKQFLAKSRKQDLRGEEAGSSDDKEEEKEEQQSKHPTPRASRL